MLELIESGKREWSDEEDEEPDINWEAEDSLIEIDDNVTTSMLHSVTEFVRRGAYAVIDRLRVSKLYKIAGNSSSDIKTALAECVYTILLWIRECDQNQRDALCRDYVPLAIELLRSRDLEVLRWALRACCLCLTEAMFDRVVVDTLAIGQNLFDIFQGALPSDVLGLAIETAGYCFRTDSALFLDVRPFLSVDDPTVHAAAIFAACCHRDRSVEWFDFRREFSFRELSLLGRALLPLLGRQAEHVPRDYCLLELFSHMEELSDLHASALMRVNALNVVDAGEARCF